MRDVIREMGILAKYPLIPKQSVSRWILPKLTARLTKFTSINRKNCSRGLPPFSARNVMPRFKQKLHKTPDKYPTAWLGIGISVKKNTPLYTPKSTRVFTTPII
jgi:hypothetical protein